ncbi:hypothetical protein, conserved [Eimeria maxima]|uniref:Uncharacterized protein n=1 Tax=Eimeria maxima TaxID=5804 RepID=U6LZ12_EIMMA|nr:hypothetical protein, conserved [Eimeria maxima]CDJ57192.1 hypothetical protein, conserved [Eimeria maxima]
MRFPDVILGTSALNVLTANVQPNRTPETDDILLNDPHNKQSPLSFLVDTIKLPLVSGLREADEQRSSAGVISQGEHDPKPTEDEELQRRDGYIVGEEYSGPGFQPADQVILEDPPLFAMQNISLLPPQARKPINLAVRQFTAQMQRAAVEYCTANNLNCSEQHALETAISVALRTSPTASMFRQISASLSAMEGAITSALRPLGWPVDPRSPEAPKPPPKPRVQITQAVQFAFSLVGTAVALLRSFIHITKGPTPLITLDTQLHEHHRNILSKLLYSGREIEGCSMTVPLRHLSNCRSFAIEVPARTDKCSVPATTQANAPSSLTVHGFELACLASLRCSQHYTAYQPFNLDGRYILTPSSDGAVSFAKTIPRAFSQENIPAGVLHLYRSEEGKANSDILKYTIAAVSAAPS